MGDEKHRLEAGGGSERNGAIVSLGPRAIGGDAEGGIASDANGSLRPAIGVSRPKIASLRPKPADGDRGTSPFDGSGCGGLYRRPDRMLTGDHHKSS